MFGSLDIQKSTLSDFVHYIEERNLLPVKLKKEWKKLDNAQADPIRHFQSTARQFGMQTGALQELQAAFEPGFLPAIGFRGRLGDFAVCRTTEGEGKSSVVKPLVQQGAFVIFCCKSNEQLIEQEQSFRTRWPDLRIHRHVSKARNFQERVQEEYGFLPRVVLNDSDNPYAMGGINETKTIAELVQALTEFNAQTQANALFQEHYRDYKPPKVDVHKTDVLLITLAAFQVYLQANRKPWWEKIGLRVGTLKSGFFSQYSEHPSTWSKVYQIIKPKSPEEEKRYKPLGRENIHILIDDPDLTDFDFRRMISNDDAEKLKRAKRRFKENQLIEAAEHDQKANTEYWTKLHYPPFLSKALAEYHAAWSRVHKITADEEQKFIERPRGLFCGYGITRGYQYGNLKKPCLIVLTTEFVTEKLAIEHMSHALRCNEKWPWELHKLLHREVPTELSKTTLVATKLTRKTYHGLFHLVLAVLRQEFPEEDLTLIANGIGSKLNLVNNRGRNDLADKSTLIKLSAPAVQEATNLWAQFKTDSPREIMLLRLVDKINQALGRNQGNRFQHRHAILAVDPLYAPRLINTGLIRYQLTPWSSHLQDTNTKRPSAFEERAMQLLDLGHARALGCSTLGMTIGRALPPEQRLHYEHWLRFEDIPFDWEPVPFESDDVLVQGRDLIEQESSVRGGLTL